MKLNFFVLSLLLGISVASPGDRLDEFQHCTAACEYSRKCPTAELREFESSKNEFNKIKFDQTPVVLEWLVFWDCRADCDYQCQQIITRERILYKQEIYQFHGKWPFLRLLGMQELFSVLFSIGNFVPHYVGYQKLSNRINKLQYRSKNTHHGILLSNYMMVAIAGMFAWSASSIFHFRDLLITEKLDYFFAGGTVLSGFHAILSRICRFDQKPLIGKIFTWSVIVIFSGHILRLYLDWSYTYNMRFNVFFGLLQYVLLLILAYQNYISLRSQHKGKQNAKGNHQRNMWHLCIMPVILVITTASGMSFELFDFFNYSWQIDSHALWHLCTIWPSWALYDFFIADFNFATKEVSD